MRTILFSASLILVLTVHAAASEEPAVPLDRRAPEYPVQCESAPSVKHSVVLQFDITRGGQTENVVVLQSSDSCFNETAVAAVRGWEYQPAQKNGRRVSQEGIIVTLSFLMNEPAETEDFDARPRVRMPPQYPERCMRTASKFEVVSIQFDVNTEGETENVQVIESTNACLNRAAIGSVAQWRYSPKLIDGKPVRRTGIITQVRFQLSDDDDERFDARRHVLQRIQNVHRRNRRGEDPTELLNQLVEIESKYGDKFTQIELANFHFVRAAVRLEMEDYEGALSDLYVVRRVGMVNVEAREAVEETIASLEAYLDVGRENLQSDETAETDTQN